MSKRRVPWYNLKEWKTVYSSLYSLDKQKQVEGLKRVKAWLARGRVPHSVEITASMVEVGLNQSCSELELRYLLSMVIIRFVNGIVDAGQKGVYASSAIGVAEQLGLPVWFVEQRHQATHDRIPSLPYLQQSRIAALEWLRLNYWVVQDTAHQELKDSIFTKMKEYKSMALEKNYKQERKLAEDITGLLSSEDIKEILIPVFVDEIFSAIQIQSNDVISLTHSSISNEMKNYKIFIDTCIAEFPNFLLILFEHLLTTNSTIATVEFLRYVLTYFKFNANDTLLLLKTCFENYSLSSATECLKIIKKFDTMPEDEHRYHTLIKFVLGYEDTLNIENFEMDEVVKQIEMAKKALENSISAVNLETNNSKWVLTEINCQVGEILPDEDLDLDPCFDDLTWLNDNHMLFIPIDGVTETPFDAEANADEIEVFDSSKLVIY